MTNISDLDTTAKAMNRLRTMTLEDWNTSLQVASVVVLGVTFLVGAGALWTSYLVGKRHEARIAAIANESARANENAARLNERAARAELELAELRKRQGPRWLDHDKFAAALTQVVPASVTIWYLPDDGEAYLLASQIFNGLNRTKWTVSRPEHLPLTAAMAGWKNAPERYNRLIPRLMRVGANPIGVSLVVKSIPTTSTDGKMSEVTPTAFTVISKALLAGGLGSVGGGEDHSLSPNDIIVVAGPKE